MGGMGSGRPRRRAYLGQLLNFSAKSVANSYGGTITWSTGSSIGVTRIEDRLLLDFSSNGAPVRQEVSIYRQPCRFGGTRAWFLCPICGEVCLKLYFLHGRFRCRTCTGCPYYTQTAGKEDRLTYRLRKFQQRLLPKGEDANDFDTFYVPSRPAWMRRRTYNRLRERCLDLAETRESEIDAKFDQYVMPRLARMTDMPLDDLKKAFGDGRG